MESFFRLVNAVIPPPLSFALVSPTHIAKGWKCWTLQPFCRWTWICINFLHLPSLPPPLCALPLTPLCLSNFPNFCHFSFIFLAIVISPSHMSGFISVPTNTYCTEQAGQALCQCVHLQLICFWMRETKPLNVLVKFVPCLSLSTCKF